MQIVEGGGGGGEFRVESPERISAAVDSFVGGGDDGGDLDFSFVLFPESVLPPIAADDIFSDGMIRPIYPVFNRDLLPAKGSADPDPKPPLRRPLRRLFVEEEEEEEESFSSTSSSSTASSSMDELEGVPEGTYCVWDPKDRRKKSNSKSSSLRWRLRDLVIGRSHSYAKERLVFIPIQQEKEKPDVNNDDAINSNKLGKKSTMMTMMRKRGSGQGGQEDLPTVKRTGSAGRRSYLPYKTDLVGFFSHVNVNGLRGPTPF